MNYHCCVCCHFPLLSTCSLAFLLALSWFPTIAFMQSLWLFEWCDITWLFTHSGPLLFLFVDYAIPWDAIGSNYHVFSIENIFGFFFHCSVLWISHFLVWVSEENTKTNSCCKRKVKSGVMIHFWMYQNIMKFRMYYLLIWQHGTSRIDRNFDECKLLNVFSKCQGRLLGWGYHEWMAGTQVTLGIEKKIKGRKTTIVILQITVH